MKRKKLPTFKKDIKDFLLSEEGKITKKNIAKLGVSLVILGMMLEPETASAAHTSHGSHGNAFFSTGEGGHNSGGSHGSHSSHGSHGSHGSHSNHGAHGSW